MHTSQVSLSSFKQSQICSSGTVIVLWRLYKFRREIDGILNASRMGKGRFFRLLILSITLIFAVLPLSIESVYRPVSNGQLHTYSWTEVHSGWGPLLVPTFGQLVQWDGVISIICGYIVFICFGVGQDAVDMYKSWGLHFGLDKYFPSLLPASRTSSRATWTLSSLKSSLLWKSSLAPSRTDSL